MRIDPSLPIAAEAERIAGELGHLTRRSPAAMSDRDAFDQAVNQWFF